MPGLAWRFRVLLLTALTEKWEREEERERERERKKGTVTDEIMIEEGNYTYVLYAGQTGTYILEGDCVLVLTRHTINEDQALG